jgi:hypothetical protein
MAKEPSGARLIQFGVSAELVERFLDFCEGYEGAPVHRLLARAMEFYMADHPGICSPRCYRSNPRNP